MNYRPLGITILAGFGFLRGGMGLLGCLALMTADTPPKSGYLMGQIPDALVFGSGSAFTLVLSWSLYSGHRWAWWFHTVFLANVVVLFLTLVAALQIGGPKLNPDLSQRVTTYSLVFGAWAICPLLLLLYFMKRTVVDYFELSKSRGHYFGLLLVFSVPAIALGLWGSRTSFAQWQLKTTRSSVHVRMSAAVICKTETPAFDPKTPTKRIGSFTKDTRLKIINRDAGLGLTLVEYTQPNGQKIQALCNPEDLEPAD